MNFGVWIPNCRHLATPDIIKTTAVRAEQLGYDSVWVSDHVVVPRANIPNFGETVFDPLVTLAVVAGATSDVHVLTSGQSAPPSSHAGRALTGEPAALVDQIGELAACGVEHLVLEFLAADGGQLDEQMALFAERVRPRVA